MNNANLSYPNPSLSEVTVEIHQPAGPGMDELQEPPAGPHRAPDTRARRVLLTIMYVCDIYRPPTHAAVLTHLGSILSGLMFSCLDTSIVSTALISITVDLHDSLNAPWTVLAYLLTYMSKQRPPAPRVCWAENR
jgi:hypothetical protein